MNIQEFREYCISKPGVTEDTPFGPNTLVLKVMDRMFALTDIDNFESINLKCEPEKAAELREEFDGVRPGYHMNKKHWNTVATTSDVNDKMLKELIDHSYKLVVEKLPKKDRQALNTLQ